MKKIAIKIFLLTIVFQAIGQKASQNVGISVKFDTIISHFQKRNFTKEKNYLPIIHKNNEYSIELSRNPLPLRLNQIVVKSPNSSKYPISYSVVYNRRLITLFEEGNFISQSIETFQRDIEFEKILNTRKFQYHWLIDNKLVGLSDNKYYLLNSSNIWEEYKNQIPISDQPILFEDSAYISFCDCHGEWGGTVYFLNKNTNNIHFTEATCANSIIKHTNKYKVLSTLGHMTGHADLLEISNPNDLPIVESSKINKRYFGDALGYSDTSEVAVPIFSFSNIQIFASFFYKKRLVYLVQWNDATFLAEIENSVIKIINPLFNKDFQFVNAITTNFDDTILINIIFYRISEGRVSTCLIIRDGKLTKLDWNEKHFR
jgi:hypothetical protein